MTRFFAMILVLAAPSSYGCFLSFTGTFRCGANAPEAIWTCGQPVRITTHAAGVTAQVEVGPLGGEVAAAPANTMWLAYMTGPSLQRQIGITPDNHLIARDQHGLYISDTAGSKTAGAFLAAVNAIAQCKVEWKGETTSTTTP
jgi:hypothetical protein